MSLRLLRSAFLASALLAADLVLLTLLLNPGADPGREAVALLGALGLPWLVAGTVVLWLVGTVASGVSFWPRPLRSPLPPLPWFTSLSLLALSTAAALFWLNLLAWTQSVPVVFVRALLGSAIAVSGAALALLAVCVDVWAFPHRPRVMAGPLVVLACAAAVAVPLALRPTPPPAERPVPLSTESTAPARRVILLGIDGLGPRQLREGVDSGNLAALGRILRRGAGGPLGTLRPTEGPPIWTTIVTGRLPRDHGIKSFAAYRLRGSDTVYELLPRGAGVAYLERAGLVGRLPVTSAARRCRTLWDEANAFGMTAGVVRVWGTYPAEPVKGFMLSPYFDVRGPAQVAGTLHPRDLAPEVQAAAVAPRDLDPALVSEFVDTGVEVPGGEVIDWRRELLERALAPDLTYQRAGAVLRTAYDPQLFVSYQYGLDVVGHVFTRFADPERFGNVRPEEVRKYGRVTARYAALLSDWVDGVAHGLRPGEVLLVVSGYGMEPLPLWRRGLNVLAGMGGQRSGTHQGAPDGVLLAIGDGIRPGARLQAASVLDVTPTVLYLMGLPVGRDMEGRVLTEIIDDEFVRSHPLTFIPSYESLEVRPPSAPPEALPPLPEEIP